MSKIFSKGGIVNWNTPDPDERGQELIGEPTPIFVVILIKYLEPPFNEFALTPLEARENKLWICAGLIPSPTLVILCPNAIPATIIQCSLSKRSFYK